MRSGVAQHRVLFRWRCGATEYLPGWQSVDLRFHRRRCSGGTRSITKTNTNSDTNPETHWSGSYPAGDHCPPDSDADPGASNAPADAEANTSAHSGTNAAAEWIPTGREATVDRAYTDPDTKTETDAPANASADANTQRVSTGSEAALDATTNADPNASAAASWSSLCPTGHYRSHAYADAGGSTNPTATRDPNT